MKITIKDLNKYYGKKHVLKDINITLENGVYGLIGPNGVGKTTFLHVLLSLLSFENGIISIDEDIAYGSDEFISKVGYLPQYPTFYPSFTAYDFLVYMCILKGLESSAIEKSGVLEQVMQLEKGADSILTREFDDRGVVLSGGQAQKIAVAQVLPNYVETKLKPVSREKIHRRIRVECYL